MITDSLRTELWSRLEFAFNRVAGELESRNPRLWWGAGYRSTEVQPFDAWVAFNRSGTVGEEDIVVFVGFCYDHQDLVASVDISTGEGVVLSDGPVLRIKSTLQAGQIRNLLRNYMEDVERYLAADVELLRRNLC